MFLKLKIKYYKHISSVPGHHLSKNYNGKDGGSGNNWQKGIPTFK